MIDTTRDPLDENAEEYRFVIQWRIARDQEESWEK